MQKLIRVTTIPLSLNLLLKGQLSFLNKYYSVFAISGKGQDLEEVKKRESVPTIEIEMERGISVLKDIKSFWRLYRCFRNEKPRIVHSITPKAGLLSMAAAYFAKVPIRMHTFTGLIFPSKRGFFRELLIYMDKSLCFFATNVYPEGLGVKNDLIKFNITSKPLKVLANGNINGVDTSLFNIEAISQEEKIQLCTDLGIKAKDFVFIFIGRLVRDKGINELIEAFVRLAAYKREKNNANTTTIKLILVGPYESELDPLKAATIKEIQNNANILSVGFQSDIRPYLAISSVLTFPSYREGFPNVVLQAGAMGIASIVTNINGCNEIIETNRNGLIIPVRDTQALFEAMKKLFIDKDFTHILAENSRSVILEKYKREVVWSALLTEYERLEKELEEENS